MHPINQIYKKEKLSFFFVALSAYIYIYIYFTLSYTFIIMKCSLTTIVTAVLLIQHANGNRIPPFISNWWQQPLNAAMPVKTPKLQHQDLPTAEDALFGGIATFAHLPYEMCWQPDSKFDIAFVGAPFDTCKS